MKKYGQAAVIQMVVEKLPDIAKAVSEPLSKVNSITMYGEGNGSKMIGDIMTSMDQISTGLGINVPDLIKSTLTGRAAGDAIADKVTEAKARSAERPATPRRFDNDTRTSGNQVSDEGR